SDETPAPHAPRSANATDPKLAPRHRRPLGSRIDAGPAEDGPDGAGTDAVAQSAQLAMNSAVAPGRILPGQSRHQASDLRGDRWPAASAHIGPAPADQIPMPAQQCFGPHEQPAPTSAG